MLVLPLTPVVTVVVLFGEVIQLLLNDALRWFVQFAAANLTIEHLQLRGFSVDCWIQQLGRQRCAGVAFAPCHVGHTFLLINTLLNNCTQFQTAHFLSSCLLPRFNLISVLRTQIDLHRTLGHLLN